MTVYVCEDSFDGILCGVYDAWMSRKGHDHVRLEIDGTQEPELFCQYEPVVEVVTPGQEKVTYVKMTAEKALRVVNDHLVNGNVVSEYTIGANAIGAK